MPSNLPTNESEGRRKVGALYVVATPIGNRDDITVRALSVLREVDLIAAEDTRKTRRLLTRHNIKCSLISYHEHNEDKRTPQLMDKLKEGVSIALVSNAGTPSVSDPGYRLIESAAFNNIRVIPIPGVSAVTAALSVAGLPTDTFVFAGFLSKKKAKRLKQLNELATEQRTIILYESPKRILSLLKEIIAAMGDRNGVLAREMTKLHEEFVRGLLSEIIEKLKKRPQIKGECTLLVAGSNEKESISWEQVRIDIRSELESNEIKVSEIAKHLSKKYYLPKKKIYAETLRLRRQKSENR